MNAAVEIETRLKSMKYMRWHDAHCFVCRLCCKFEPSKSISPQNEGDLGIRSFNYFVPMILRGDYLEMREERNFICKNLLD